MGEVIFGRFGKPIDDQPQSLKAGLPVSATAVASPNLFHHIAALDCRSALDRFEQAVSERLFAAIPLANALKRDSWAWYDFQDLLKDHGLKAPIDADLPDALYHVIRWTMRDIKGWSDNMSRECCSDIQFRQSLILSEPEDHDELTSADIAHILEWARFFRRKKSD
ncbi:hypothetical protein [Devosia submarina]|uniref:hypothetical protein n=1 Tax=Devosia submarina TaxID=1173082 RepID=UPI000D350E76|nr:hypothetical protein [Devosia submarina]